MRWLVVALLVAGCASPNSKFVSGGPYPTFEAATRAGFEASMESYSSPAERAEAIECYTKAVVDGVPDEDQAIMLKAMNTQHYPPDVTAVFERWIPMDSSSAEVGNAAIERVHNNAMRFCPDFMARNPDAFS